MSDRSFPTMPKINNPQPLPQSVIDDIMTTACPPSLEAVGFVKLSKVDRNTGIASFYKEIGVYRIPGSLVKHEGILYSNEHFHFEDNYYHGVFIECPEPLEI